MVHKNGLKRMLSIKYLQYEYLVIKSELQKENELNIQEGNEMIQYEKLPHGCMRRRVPMWLS